MLNKVKQYKKEELMPIALKKWVWSQRRTYFQGDLGENEAKQLGLVWEIPKEEPTKSTRVDIGSDYALESKNFKLHCEMKEFAANWPPVVEGESYHYYLFISSISMYLFIFIFYSCSEN